VMILCDYCLNFLSFVNRGNLSCLFWIGWECALFFAVVVDRTSWRFVHGCIDTYG
jgi:hypothetical protein